MGSFSEIMANLGGSAAILTAIYFAVKSLVGHLATKNVESHKAELQRTSNLELEKLRHELKLLSTDIEGRREILNTKRALIIEELYKKLVTFIGAAESFSSIMEWSGEPSKEEKAKTLGKAAGEFYECYKFNRIYFSPELSEKLKALFDAVHGPTLKFRMWMNSKDQGGEAATHYHDAWSQAWKTIQDDIPPVLAEVEKEFRVMLGVHK